MRRLVILITAVAALALVPGASAFVRTVPPDFAGSKVVFGGGTFDGNTFSLAMIDSPFFPVNGGSLSFSTTDALGRPHSYSAQGDCFTVASNGADAGILAHLVSDPAPVGEPATLFG